MLHTKTFRHLRCFVGYWFDGSDEQGFCQQPIERQCIILRFQGCTDGAIRLARTENNQALSVYYWSAENSRGEIDFLLQDEDKIVPIEVKAEENLQAKSLKAFVERNPSLKGVRLSMSPYREQDWLTNYPLYSIEAIINSQEGM